MSKSNKKDWSWIIFAQSEFVTHHHLLDQRLSFSDANYEACNLNLHNVYNLQTRNFGLGKAAGPRKK